MTTSFVPSADTSRAYRDVLGCFATGVTVVTAAAGSRPVGMTVNSFSSISLDPPLILWSPSKTSNRYPTFEAAQYFAVHVLTTGQLDLALAFAKDSHAFDGLDWTADSNGVPIFDSCLARFDCQMHTTHDGGDHAIVVGRVLRANVFGGDPLVFASGSFGRFQAAP